MNNLKIKYNEKMNHNIYIIRSYGRNESIIKVGYSANIEKRLSAYKEHNPYVEIVSTFYIDDGLTFEKTLHQKFKSVYKYEWYNEDQLNDIIDYINNYPENRLKPLFGIKLEDLYKGFLDADDKEAYKYEYPEFFDYQQYLTVTEMNTQRWNKEKINKLLSDKKLLRLAHKKVSDKINNGFITNVDLKQLYEDVFNEIGITIKSKATLIEENKFIDSRSVRKTENGKTIRGYEIATIIFQL